MNVSQRGSMANEGTVDNGTTLSKLVVLIGRWSVYGT